MSNGALAGGTAAGAAATAIARAIKASGVLVRVEPEEFRKLAERSEKPLIVIAPGAFFGKGLQYLMSYRGLAFYAKSREPIRLPGDADLISAKKIWIPG